VSITCMDVKAEINVTPLVDVCLVMLIIFMVVTPLMTGPQVNLPHTLNPAKEIDENKFTITILSDATIYWNQDWIPRNALLAKLKQVGPDKTILVRADRNLTYGEVKQVLDLMVSANIHNAGLISEKMRANPH
jgi:biopolymer transport protein TolR